MNRKPFLSAFFAAILIGGLVLVEAMRFGTVQASTEVNGIISADIIWTRTNSIVGLLTIETANAQTGVTQPAIPRFEASLSTYPNYIPPTYGVDPSTGKAVVTKEGYEVIYKWVSVRVYGQPFWEYNNSEGERVLLYYNVRWQSNLDTAWQTFPNDVGYFEDSMDPWDTYGDGYLISIGFKGIDDGGIGMQFLDPKATEISFQVEALIGYYDSNNVFVGQSSGWSNAQTLTIGESQTPTPSPSPSPTATSSPVTTSTPTPSSSPEPESFPAALVIASVAGVAVGAVGLLVYFRKRKIKSGIKHA